MNANNHFHKQEDLTLEDIPELGEAQNSQSNGNPPPPSTSTLPDEPEPLAETTETKPKRLDWFWATVAMIFWGSSLVSTYLSLALLLGVNGGSNVQIPLLGRYIGIDTIVSVMGTGILEGGSLYLAFEKRKEDQKEDNDSEEE